MTPEMMRKAHVKYILYIKNHINITYLHFKKVKRMSLVYRYKVNKGPNTTDDQITRLHSSAAMFVKNVHHGPGSLHCHCLVTY